MISFGQRHPPNRPPCCWESQGGNKTHKMAMGQIYIWLFVTTMKRSAPRCSLFRVAMNVIERNNEFEKSPRSKFGRVRHHSELWLSQWRWTWKIQDHCIQQILFSSRGLLQSKNVSRNCHSSYSNWSYGLCAINLSSVFVDSNENGIQHGTQHVEFVCLQKCRLWSFPWFIV